MISSSKTKLSWEVLALSYGVSDVPMAYSILDTKRHDLLAQLMWIEIGEAGPASGITIPSLNAMAVAVKTLICSDLDSATLTAGVSKPVLGNDVSRRKHKGNGRVHWQSAHHPPINNGQISANNLQS